MFGLVGELRNDAAFTDDSHEGMAMDMTSGGNQHVHVAAGEFLNIASSVDTVTIAFWQKNYSIPSTSSFWAEPGRAMQAHVPWSNGEIYWDTAGCCGGGQRINANATDIAGWGEDMLDTWHHYVFIKNEGLKEIYIDGEFFHDGENINPLPSDITHLNIGGDANGNNSLRGVIDDFAVFASALDEDQILALSEGDRSILPAAPSHPIFVSASPDTAAADGSAELSVTLYKRGDDASNAQLSVNGTDVATTVATDGTTITITGTATGLASGTATAQVSYNGVSNAWAISVPNRPVDQGDGTVTFAGHVAWEWWDGIGGAHPMENLTDNARYPDSPDGATFAPSWNTRTALAGGFEGNGRDSYGGRMSGILTAPETGTYRFFIASDDHGLLRISTDADPANAVRVAEETGCCKNFTLDDGGLSGTVDLVEGNQYYMEALLKEGGGGDWMTVGWRKPSEDIDDVPAGNQEGIPGEYFASTVRVPALSALSSSLSVAAGNSMDPKATITLNVTDGATTLDAGSVAISLGGTALDSTTTEGTWSKDFAGVAQSGATYSISAATGAIDAGTEYSVSATFKDSAGASTTLDATFTIPVWELYGLGTKAPATAAGSISVRQYQGIGGGFNNLITSSKFPDSPDFEERVGYLEWPQSGDINVKPAGNVQDNYGVQLIGFLHPPASGDYQFAIASDDNSQLWLSTDESPANRVLIAKESGWQPIRKYQPVGDEATSEFITLEGGKAYYIEILNKEGGGGDNVAVAWTTGDAIVPDALPISGDYLSPWVPEASGAVDITSADDAVVPSSDNHPAGEHAGLAIDDNASTKYLNFDGANDTPSGLTITTGGGVVTGLGLTSANDAPDRDPSTFILSGSNDGGATFAEIAAGDVPAFSERFERVEVSFDNSVAYTTYQVTFPTTAGPSTCCMQIAEIELLGTPAAGGDGPEAPALPWSVGLNDDGWPAGDGGGPNTSFMQETGVNDLPGDPASPEVAQQADDDYYWAGVYSTVIDGNGDYEPVGLVEANEEAAERAFAGVDNDLRYHFNLPSSLQSTDQLSISYDALNLHGGQADSRYGIEVYVNNVQVQPEIVIREAQLGETYTTEPFSLADVNAEVGSGYDNIITLKGVNYNAEGGGNWMGIDYVQLNQVVGDTPALSVVNNGDGTVTVTFEGTLQSAPTVNGPWSDVDGASPLTIPADQAAQFGRAKN